MSAGETLLIFLSREEGFDCWLRLANGAVTARGDGIADLPPLMLPDSGDPLRVAAAVPGDAVMVHWLDLPAGLSPPQANAAARLIAAERSAAPVDTLHVAVGPDDGDDAPRCVAIVSAEQLAAWIGRCQSVGVDPDLILPEPLLLLPREGRLLRHERAGTPLYRGTSEAFSVEPDLAALAFPQVEVEPVGEEGFEGGLAEAVANPAVNLRQGAFARRRRWKVDWKLVRRLSLLATAILIVSFAIQLTLIIRYTFAADRLEAEARQVASGALGEGVGVSNAPRQLSQRLAELQGSGAGYSGMASALFAAVRDTPNAELGAIAFDAGGTLRATVIGDSPATLAALAQRIEAAGLAADPGALRSMNGRQSAEMTVRMP